MKFLTDILQQHYETKVFPEDLCTIQNSREPDVFDSIQKFECVIHTDKWGTLAIRELFPYIWKNNGIDEDITDPVCYGWVDKSGNLFDHFEKQIHLDDALVVGWRKIE
jgi:hypothetical protein